MKKLKKKEMKIQIKKKLGLLFLIVLNVLHQTHTRTHMHPRFTERDNPNKEPGGYRQIF